MLARRAEPQGIPPTAPHVHGLVLINSNSCDAIDGGLTGMVHMTKT
jgi:hypothetical protein